MYPFFFERDYKKWSRLFSIIKTLLKQMNKYKKNYLEVKTLWLELILYALNRKIEKGKLRFDLIVCVVSTMKY